ncbi:hypothetical protein QZH41_011289 [Actinostola sp. cb2023]|nr:hypothetical protein QZH41_011289 [Actinostola sp. cb2023]
MVLTGKLRWESHSGKLKVPYIGIPFILGGQKILECMYGGRKQKKRSSCQEAMQNFISKIAKKQGCKATMNIGEVTLFNKFDISTEEKWKSKCMMERKLKPATLDKVRKAIRDQVVIITKIYYVEAPYHDAHSNHSLGEYGSVENPLHPELIAKM